MYMGSEMKSDACILGIETSCDETAAAVVRGGRDILSNVVASQIDLHRAYGGVVPEVASRQHLVAMVPVVEEAMQEAGLRWNDLAGVAVTYGPGLAGSLLVGVNMAKALCLAHNLPLVGVNHLEAHIYANWAIETSTQTQRGAAATRAEVRAETKARGTQRPGRTLPPMIFPTLCLIVSGGHTDLVLMTGHGAYQSVGRTIDDAAGEAFDKVARILGLGYPGGPAIQKTAERGDAGAFPLPRAWLKGTFDFSFSGLKTAILRLADERKISSVVQALSQGLPVSSARQAEIANLAASFQMAVVDVLVEKTRLAAERYGAKQVLLAGGVAANAVLREEMTKRLPIPVFYPPPYLCTDNAVGTAVAGHYALQRGQVSGMDLDVRPSLRLG